MKQKSGQTEIIVTVLLVLIALAAVATIAYFIMNQVKTNTASAAAKADCVKAGSVFQIESANSASGGITITRNADEVAIKELRIYLNDALNTTLTATSTPTALPDKLGKVTLTINGIKANDVIKAYPVLETGTLCDLTTAQKTVV